MASKEQVLGNRRLLSLAKILDKVPARHEDEYGNTVGYYQQDVFHSCGTPSCAWGWYLTSMRKSSYERLAKQAGFNDYDIRIARMRGPKHGRLYIPYVTHAKQEFAITDAEVMDLFDSSGMGRAKSGKDAANFIRSFVENRS